MIGLEDISMTLIIGMVVAMGVIFILVLLAYARDTFQTVTTRRLFQVAPNGRRISGRYVLQGTTTSAIAKTMSEDGGTSFTANNVPDIPIGKTTCIAILNAYSSSTHASFTAMFDISRTSGSITISSPYDINYISGSSTGWTINVTNSTDRSLLYLQAVGSASTTVTWKCQLELLYNTTT
jgi:hypothetical protein